jgi:hypothetical protein
MADDSNFGGIISISIDGVRLPPSEADITVEPSNISVEAKANQDGSPCYSSKPKLFKMDVKFRDNSNIVWDEAMKRAKIDVTASEETNNRTHLMTGARFTGTPSVNLSDGAVDGVTIEGPKYQKI